MNTKDFNSLSGKLGINIDDEWTKSLVHTELSNRAEQGDTGSLYKLVQLARFSRQSEIKAFALAEVIRLGYGHLVGEVSESSEEPEESVDEGTHVPQGTSVQDAYESLEDGGKLILDSDAGVIRATEGKSFTLNLNNRTMYDPNDENGDGVLYAKTGTITLEGDGIVDGRNKTDYAMAVWACGDSTVNLMGGTYVNENAGPDDQYDLIYVSQNSTLNIYGGTFKSATPKWTLNIQDGAFKNDTAHINVYGGRFYQYDPSNTDTEVTKPFSFVAEGYHVVQNGDWYEVVKD